MHESVYDFVTRQLGPDEVAGKRVLEVGSMDVNGSVRPYVVSMMPAEYIGTDRRAGRRVDVALNANRLIRHFGCDQFDVVICCETLEHIAQWRTALYNILAVLKIGGTLILTTRSPGFARHDHPDDHWRWHLRDWRVLARYGALKHLDRDPHCPGVFLAFRKLVEVPMVCLDDIRAVPAPLLAPQP